MFFSLPPFLLYFSVFFLSYFIHSNTHFFCFSLESLFLLNFSDGRQWQGSDKGWAALSAAWQAVAGGGICTGLPRTYHRMGAVTNSGRKWRKGVADSFGGRGGRESG